MKDRTDKAEINQGASSIGISGILEGEYTRTQEHDKGVVQTEEIPEKSTCEEDNISVVDTNIITETTGKDSNPQRNLLHEQVVDWFAVAFLVVGLAVLSMYAFRMIWKLYVLAINLYQI